MFSFNVFDFITVRFIFMIRINTSISKKRRHKKILKSNKSYVGSHSRLFRVANQEKMKSLYYSYFGRKEQKRNLKSMWIKQINIMTRKFGMNYSKFFFYLKNKEVCINRKILSKISINDEYVFSLLVVL